MRQFTLNSKPQFVQNNFEFNERPCSMFLILNILVIALHLETVTQPIIFLRCYQPPHTTKTHSMFSKQQTIANIERNPHFSVSLLHPKVFSIFFKFLSSPFLNVTCWISFSFLPDEKKRPRSKTSLVNLFQVTLTQ